MTRQKNCNLTPVFWKMSLTPFLLDSSLKPRSLRHRKTHWKVGRADAYFSAFGERERALKPSAEIVGPLPPRSASIDGVE